MPITIGKAPNLELNSKSVLEFYIKASQNEDNESKELSITELLNSLKNMNCQITNDIARDREEQLEYIKSVVNTQSYNNYNKLDFQSWTKKEFPKLDFQNNKNESVAKILGMISIVIKKEKGFYLRNAQLLAILMFISKDKKYGLVEEISTGEGKSCIICSLSIYYALSGKKVDIISSSYSLAKRDSKEFENIYEYFNLTTNYPKNSDPYPYTCDILYGTFLEFEGDCLRELISDKKIRNNRPYEVIIIDEVDNLLIDNILSSTRLTGPTKGFKFLIILYLTSYLSFELYDYIFLFIFSINLRHIEAEKRKKFERLIKEPKHRKNIIINIVTTIFESLNNNKPEIEDEDIKELVTGSLDNIDKNKNDIEIKVKKIKDNLDNFLAKLEEYLKYPDFLTSFVNFQTKNWLQNAYIAKNYMNKNIDYVITQKNKDVAPVDRKNTGETELSTVSLMDFIKC